MASELDLKSNKMKKALRTAKKSDSEIIENLIEFIKILEARVYRLEKNLGDIIINSQKVEEDKEEFINKL